MVNEELIKHLAELSKISFTDNELYQMTEDMKSIIALMDKVSKFDTTQKPYTSFSAGYEKLRKDMDKDSYSTDKVTRNAKNIKNNCFVVPKVV